ncbi:MAG: phenylalanine--tRNA ligase subunit beta [Minisyncoccia bacterium]
MKISLKWLQTYFDAPLPDAEKVADAYTFHAFEIDENDGDLLDVKVLPNRAADCLSHRGLARELAAILDVPMPKDPLRESVSEFPKTDELTVKIEDCKKCLRYAGALIKGVKIGPSPAWLKEALESVGQRSINNVVDVTNFVMLSIGQPMHAFDANKLVQKDGKYAIGIRNAKAGEKITTLSNEEYALADSILLITDANADAPIGIAGIKGGKSAEVTAGTTNIILEAANFDGTTVRRATQTLKLFTDASVRFQNRPSPELVAYGMQKAISLTTELAGGKLTGVVDIYPLKQRIPSVSIKTEHINRILGTSYADVDVRDVFDRLEFHRSEVDGKFDVLPPFERTDLVIAEDLIEEVGRILGYDRIPGEQLPPIVGEPDQARYRGIERMKDQLVEQGFIEVSTQSFAKKGDIILANPLDKNKPALRTSLEENLNEALARAKQYAPLVLAPKQSVKLFEVGTVFPKEGEFLELRMTERVKEWGDSAGVSKNLSAAKLEEYGKGYEPVKHTLGAYKPFSIYPFIVRDISMFLPEGFPPDQVRSVFDPIVIATISNLSVTINFLDQFTNKEGKNSIAFRLVFQSFERTLTDDEVNGIMEKISAALRAAGFEIR